MEAPKRGTVQDIALDSLTPRVRELAVDDDKRFELDDFYNLPGLEWNPELLVVPSDEADDVTMEGLAACETGPQCFNCGSSVEWDEATGLLAECEENELKVKEIWTAADAEFFKLTGKSLQNGPIKSFEDVRVEIESRSKPPSGDTPSATEDRWDKEKFKSAGLKVLKCLKMLVGAATQLSEFLPIPSGPVATMCANALTMVLDIPQAIRDLNEAISEVFTKVSSLLSQFRIYERLDKVDNLLARQIHLVMVSFVKICAHVVNYQQGGSWERLKHKTKKAILNDDSGLKAEMSNFETLVQQQRHVEGTVVLEEVITSRKTIYQMLEQATETGQRIGDMHGKVNRLDEDATERREEKDKTKKLMKIKDTLNVPGVVQLDTNTTQTCTNFYNKRLGGTGAWVWDHPSYQGWTSTAKNGSSPVLILSGDSASGKTLVSAMITKRLEDQKHTRIYVAHYFFPPSSKKSDDDKHPVNSALKYMAFQIARVDSTVSNALGKSCDNPERVNFRELTDLKKLWAELKIGSPGLGATYHLVFDGLEHLPEKHAEALVDFALSLKTPSDPAGSRVRVLLSGAEKVFKDHPGVEEALRIDIRHHTIPDMKTFIDHELNTRGMLRQAKPGSKQEQARRIIREKLPQSVEGSYSLLQYSLDNIIRRLDSGAGLKELEGILETSMSSHEAAIQSLQRSLGPKDIKYLNDLLKWVIFGATSMSLDQLEAAMCLCSGNESLASLEYIIENKYPAVLKLEGDCVLVQDNVKEILQRGKDSRHRLSFSQDGPTISMNITINKVDQEFCQHFLWDLAQKSIREKFSFNFDESSNRLLSSENTIEVDEFEAHHSIVRHALEFMARVQSDETKAIGRYLVAWLPFHLKQLQNLEQEEKGELTPMQKRAIADGLYHMFQTDNVFRRHQYSFEGDFVYWYPSEMQQVHEWFMDSAAVRNIDKKWLREVKLASNPTRGYMRPLVRLDTRKIDIEDDDASTSDGGIGRRLDLDWWRQVGQWCQAYLGLQDDQLDSSWFERLAEAAVAMLPWGDTSEAISEFYQKAVSLPNPRWQSYMGLGEEKFRQGNVEDAITNMEKALDLAAAPVQPPPSAPEDVIRLHLQLGDFLYKTNSLEKAAEHYASARSSCSSGDLELSRRAEASDLRVRLRTLDAQGMRRLLQETLESAGSQAHFVSLLKELARDDSHDAIIAKIFTVAKSDKPLFEGIGHALEAATASSDHSTRPDASMDSNDKFAEDEIRGVLLFDRGLAAYHYKIATAGSEPNAEAVKLWKECREQLSSVGGERAYATREAATTALSKYYFQSMTEGNHSDSLEDLERLTDAGSRAIMTVPAGFLGALHAGRGDKERSQKPLSRAMKFALQVLSDDIEENDIFGFSNILEASLRLQDLRNSAVALSLCGVPDLVTECLASEGEPNKQSLAKDIINQAKSRVPDSREQLARVQAAAEHIQAVLDDRITSLDDEPRKMYSEMKSNIEGLLSKIRSEEVDIRLEGRDYCDGTKDDGRQCHQMLDSEHDMYQCFYCFDTIFCERCWAKLVGDPGAAAPAGADIFTCSSKHKWLKVPRTGSDMYVGPKATRLRVPTDVRPARKQDGTDGCDDRVLEICFDGYVEELSLQAWKEQLATSWGFSITQEMQRVASPAQSADPGIVVSSGPLE
ncbi:Nacht and tpr domain containing protein [Apiospora arundinis]